MDKKDLRIEYKDLSLHATYPFVEHNSSPRSSMYASHISQALVLNDPDIPYILTGAEKRLGALVKNVTMPEDAVVAAVIYRYSGGFDMTTASVEAVVIYHGLETGFLDYIVIPKFERNHQYFGYKLHQTDTVPHRGQMLYKGEVLAEAPSKFEKDDWYGFGKNLNTAFMDLPGVSEDGFIVCSDVLEKLSFNVYETRKLAITISGDTMEGVPSINVPLNLYGNDEEYKIFPDIGTYVRDDAVVMALRKIRFTRMMSNSSWKALRELEYKTDEKIYTRNNRGKVVDAVVMRQPGLDPSPLPIYKQLDQYARMYKLFNQQILDAEENIVEELVRKNKPVRFSNRLMSLLVDARVHVSAPLNKRKRSTKERSLIFTERKDPNGDYKVILTIEHKLTPGIGSKLSDRAGGKGVIVEIRPPEEMPVDEYGVRADIVVDKNSIVSRMNPGRYYEQAYNYATVHTTKQVREILNLGQIENKDAALQAVENLPSDIKRKAINHVKGLYKVVSPKQHAKLKGISREEIDKILATIVSESVYIWKDLSDEREPLDIVRALKKTPYYPEVSKVSWRGYSGKFVKSNEPIMIAPTYILLLEKIGDSGMAVSSPLTNHIGVFIKAPKHSKYNYPVRLNPVRIIGESETRIICGFTGQKGIGELLDQGSSYTTHRIIYRRFLEEEEPMKIEKIVDRVKQEYGKTIPIQIIEHIYYCQGIRDVYKKIK